MSPMISIRAQAHSAVFVAADETNRSEASRDPTSRMNRSS